MPSSPHLVYGKVKLPGTNTYLEDVTVTVTDVTLDESLTVTTNASGEYTANLANMSGTWSSGDSLSVVATLGNRSKTMTATASGGSTRLDFTLAIETYPEYNLNTEEPISFSALDIMDCQKTFTYNSKKQVTKEVSDYGFVTITKYFKYNSDSTVASINVVVE